MRLDKILAHQGFGSRKEVKKTIRSGLVLVNGEIVRDDDAHVDPDEDEIIVGDELIDYSEKSYWILNKPQDVVSATTDTRYSTVIDLLPTTAGRGLFPVGRLDVDTEGLLVITNDGALAHTLLSPKHHVEKEYEVTLRDKWNEVYQKSIEVGILVQNPTYQCAPAKVEVRNDHVLRLTITEGKYHQVKRMMEACDNEVVHLVRIRMGNLRLDPSLKLGEFRQMLPNELSLLSNTEQNEIL